MLIAFAAILLGKAEEPPLNDDPTIGGPPTFSLRSPGVVTTFGTEPFSSFQIHAFFLGAARSLHTNGYFLPMHSESPGIQAHEPVDWEKRVPWHAELFAVTAGVSPDVVRQFWVGWTRDGQVSMEALTQSQTFNSPLEEKESLVLPAVMDGTGGASVYSWRPTPRGAALWQRVFSVSGSSNRMLIEIPGLPVVSRAWAIPGLRSRHAIIGWVENSESKAAVLGIASVEDGRVAVRRSEPLEQSAPIPQQRIGVWGRALNRAEVSAVVTQQEDGHLTYKLASFGISGESPSPLKTVPVSLRDGQLARAGIEYSSHGDEASSQLYLLTTDGTLSEGYPEWGRYAPQALKRGVRLDSVLPIVEGYWGEHGPDGRLVFKELHRL